MREISYDFGLLQRREEESSVRKNSVGLDIFLYGNIWSQSMARAATTADVFNAIAEPRRREIIGVLVDGKEWAVGDVVKLVRLPQPAVSKHLGVLRRVGVVTVVKRGQHRMYRLNGAELKPVHDWAKTFEKYWTHQISRIKERAEQKAVERIGSALPSEAPDSDK
jgi:DNA-binding transcriptional ArsR family regulator